MHEQKWITHSDAYQQGAKCIWREFGAFVLKQHFCSFSGHACTMGIENCVTTSSVTGCGYTEPSKLPEQ
jgi:hypothetical protein